MLLTVGTHDAHFTVATVAWLEWAGWFSAIAKTDERRPGWTDSRRLKALALTRDGVLVAVALADADQEGTIFVLGRQQQLLSFHAVYVAVVPPAETTEVTVRPLCLA